MSDGQPPAPTVAFVGLGNMGLPMARRLLGGGLSLRVFDVAPEPAQVLAAEGAYAAASPAAAGRDADVVVLMLPSSTVVESVLADDALGGALRAGTVVVDMSSSEPLRTQALAARLSGSSVQLVDAPVSGGVSRAESGELTIMAGGDADVLDRVAPVLDLLGDVTRTGPVGSGHAAKALNNLLSATHLLVTSEAMLAGERFGLDPATLLAVFNSSSGRSASTELKWPRFILPGTFDSGFALRLMVKDMRIAVDLMASLGVPGELGTEAVRVWSSAAEDLPADADHTEIARWLAHGNRAPDRP